MLLNSLYNRNKSECIESGTFIAKRISEEIELAAREKYSIIILFLKKNIEYLILFEFKGAIT